MPALANRWSSQDGYLEEDYRCLYRFGRRRRAVCHRQLLLRHDGAAAGGVLLRLKRQAREGGTIAMPPFFARAGGPLVSPATIPGLIHNHPQIRHALPRRSIGFRLERLARRESIQRVGNRKVSEKSTT